MDTRQHSQSQHIHFQHPHGIDVVLVPFDNGAVFHGGVFDGDHLAQGGSGDDKASHVLGEVAGKAGDLVDQSDQVLDGGVEGIEPQLAQAIGPVVAEAAFPPVYVFGQMVYAVERQTQSLAHFADGAAAAGSDHLRG